jgi:hypothetical protein
LAGKLPWPPAAEVTVKHLFIGISICLVIASLVVGQDVPTLNSIEHPFAEGGLVNLKLSSGEYIIRAGNAERVLVQWTPERPSDSIKMKKIKVIFQTSGTAITIRTDGPVDDARVLIEIPPRSDLNLKMFAGAVRIEDIQGDKNIKLTFGDLTIDANPNTYRSVRASVKLGGLNAPRFQISKGGLGQAFDWQGAGPYRLHARLFAGDIALN